MVRRALALAAVWACACQGSGKATAVGEDSGAVGSGVPGFGSARHVTPPLLTASDDDGGSADMGSDVVALGSGSSASSGFGSGSGSDSDVAEPILDPGKRLFEMGAVPAWQTVIDRTLYLERRKQHGVAYGVLGGDVMVPAPPPEPAAGSGSAIVVAPPARGSGALVSSPYVWLVDDTEGGGALAIRAKLPDNARVHPQAGDRVALGGAWTLDDDRRWYWKVDAITALPPGPPPKTPWGPPGHQIETSSLPAGAHTLSLAKEGELAYFMLVGQPPANDGDGWPVADELGNPVYALLMLPGERASYGSQDMRAADERWALRRGQTYVLRLGRIHKRTDGKPATITTKSAPVRVM